MNLAVREYSFSDWFIHASISLLNSIYVFCACSWSSSTHLPELTTETCCRIVAERNELAITYVLRLDCSRKCLTSQEREAFIKLCLSSSLALYLGNLSLHVVHIQSSYLASLEHHKLWNFYMSCRTALHISWLHWFSLARQMFGIGHF